MKIKGENDMLENLCLQEEWDEIKKRIEKLDEREKYIKLKEEELKKKEEYLNEKKEYLEKIISCTISGIESYKKK